MLTRWDPVREMMGLRRAMDRLFDDAMVSSPGWDNVSRMELALDVSESDDAYSVKASIPGVNPDDIDITYNANTLTIKGEVKEEKEVQEARYHLRERRSPREDYIDHPISLSHSVLGSAYCAVPRHLAPGNPH